MKKCVYQVKRHISKGHDGVEPQKVAVCPKPVSLFQLGVEPEIDRALLLLSDIPLADLAVSQSLGGLRTEGGIGKGQDGAEPFTFKFDSLFVKQN